MKISFEEQKENIVFRISDFDPKYEHVLKMCFYQSNGRDYVKIYPKHEKYIEKIKIRYSKYAREMFDQLGYYKPIPWEEALQAFCKRVEGRKIDWWLTGSCAACIRGIDMKPHDVDIMIDSKDVDEIRDLFCEELIEPIVDTNGWLTKDFGVIFLHARIDIASDPQDCLDMPEPVDCGPYAKKHLEKMIWNGYTIKVPPLELQLTVNKKRERTERVKLIEDFMTSLK